MSSTTPSAVDRRPRRTAASRQASGLVDVALVLAGITVAVTVQPIAGAALATIGLVLPIARRRGPRSLDAAVLDLVPDELAAAHRAVVDAAADAGDRGPAAVAAADRLVTEAAAVLARGSARGLTQTAFVNARVAVVRSLADDLTERTVALDAARRELADLDVPVEELDPGDDGAGVVVRLMVAVLLPITLLADVVRAAIQVPWLLLVGVSFRLRTAASLVAIAGRRAWSWLAGIGRELRRVRGRIADDVRAARLRTRALRLQLRLRLQAIRR